MTLDIVSRLTDSPPGAGSAGAGTGTSVVIVGGGIGGLAAGFALRRLGCAVTLLEQAPQFGEVGAGLQIAPNAGRILSRWGLLDEALQAGVRPASLIFRDALTGEELTRQALDGEFLDRYRAPYFVVHRSDLHRILLTACRQVGVDLRTDHHVDAVESKVASARVICTNGSVLESDIVIAADGLASGLRQTLVGDAPIPSGYVAYRGTYLVDKVPAAAENQDVVVHIGPGCHFVKYPLRQGEMLNQVAVFRSPSFLAGEQNWGGPEELDAAFAHCSEEVRSSLQYMWRDRWWQMADRDPTEKWIQGRMVLLGDAAHPPLQYLAQGACMAIEDAASLADKVAAALTAVGSQGWDEALEGYRLERVPRTARIQTSARVWGEIWHLDGVGRVVRNELFQRRDPADFRYLDWLYGDGVETAPPGPPHLL